MAIEGVEFCCPLRLGDQLAEKLDILLMLQHVPAGEHQHRDVEGRQLLSHILPGAVARDDDQVRILRNNLFVFDLPLVSGDDVLLGDLGPVVAVDLGVAVEADDGIRAGDRAQELGVVAIEGDDAVNTTVEGRL